MQFGFSTGIRTNERVIGTARKARFMNSDIPPKISPLQKIGDLIFKINTNIFLILFTKVD
jgi:hypothetical protein